MNLVKEWLINFLEKHYIVRTDKRMHGDKQYLCAMLITDLTYYVPNTQVIGQPITRRSINDFCGREKYFRKCLRQAHGVNIKVLGDGSYAFDSIEDIRTFKKIMYLFFLVRDTNGFIYRTEKGVIEYDK